MVTWANNCVPVWEIRGGESEQKSQVDKRWKTAVFDCQENFEVFEKKWRRVSLHKEEGIEIC